MANLRGRVKNLGAGPAANFLADYDRDAVIVRLLIA
jgi:hypothetical protein